MTTSMTGTRAQRQEAGFALIVALLTLLLLTFLGITLATTTTTELQIANNYRWSQQAYYNAEAGLELAKRFLRGQTVWSVMVPAARLSPPLPPPTWTLARPDQYGGASRNFENNACDTVGVVGVGLAGNEGYGVVLDFQNFASPYQTVSTFLGQTLNGTFTVWVRRPLSPQNDGTVIDYNSDDQLIVTAEGTAPFVGASAGTTYAFQNRAVRVLESQIRKIDPNDCENLSGQAGSGPTGSGFDPCSQVSAKGIPGATGEPAAVANQR
jgi:PilX N-terminal